MHLSCDWLNPECVSDHYSQRSPYLTLPSPTLKTLENMCLGGKEKALQHPKKLQNKSHQQQKQRDWWNIHGTAIFQTHKGKMKLWFGGAAPITQAWHERQRWPLHSRHYRNRRRFTHSRGGHFETVWSCDKLNNSPGYLWNGMIWQGYWWLPWTSTTRTRSDLSSSLDWRTPWVPDTCQIICIIILG